jgi:serine/threonine protein kinase
MSDPAASVRTILGLQAREWDGGRGPRLAHYLERFPALRTDPKVLLDLVFQEVVLREQAGERPGMEDYLTLLPELADDLRVLFTLDGVINPRPDTVVAPVETDRPGRVIDQLAAHALLPPGRLAAARSLAPAAPDAAGLVGELSRRGWLTPFQSQLVLAGRAGDLVLGDYLLLDRLGAGGMGEVFQARDRQLDRLAAVKVVRPDYLSGDALGRFAQEARSAARLAHPNVVTVYGADVSGPRPFLAMEFVAGETLSRLVRTGGPLLVPVALEVVHQVALGLQHAHEAGVVHRDVKPGNLIRAPKPDGAVVKVLDFGLAALRRPPHETDTASPLTQTGAAFGTPDYMAPEQFQDSGRADHRSDVYALGCTLYFLLTGRPPFPGGSYWDKRAAHERTDPPPVPGLPTDVARLLDRMMTKDPADRFPSAGAIAEMIARAPRKPTTSRAAPPAVATSPPSDPAPPRESADSRVAPPNPTPRRRRSVIWAVVAGLVLVAVAVVALQRQPAGQAESTRRNIEEKTPDPPPVAPGPTTRSPTLRNPADSAGSILRRFQQTDSKVYRAVFSPDGRQIVTGAEDGQVRVWDIETGNPSRPTRAFDGSKGQLWMCGFLANGKSFLTAGSGGSVQLWSWPDGKPETLSRTSAGGWGKLVWIAAADKVGKRAVSGERDAAGVLRVWDLEAKEEIGPLPGVVGETDAIAISADGTRALSGGKATTDVQHWNLTDRKALRPLKGHAGEVWAVAFSPDETFALSAGTDAKLRLWRLADGVQVAEVGDPGGNYLLCAAILPGGDRVVTGNGDKTVRIWQLPTPWDAPGGEIRPVKDLHGHTNSVHSVFLDASGTRAVTIDSDSNVIVWDVSR